MEKVLKEVRVVETDDGFRIEVSGENAREWFDSCCSGAGGHGMPFVFTCCGHSHGRKGDKEEEG
jgi:hypothetical protein